MYFHLCTKVYRLKKIFTINTVTNNLLISVKDLVIVDTAVLIMVPMLYYFSALFYMHMLTVYLI